MKALASHTVHLIKVLTFYYAHGTGTGVLHANDGRATVRILALHRHVVQLKLKQDGGIRLARQCRSSISSEVDAEKRKL